MTAKAHVLELIQKLPDEASYEQIAREVELVTGIREAQEQIARGEGYSAEEILKELPTWITKS
jgi:predicted transcriptional regulator